MDTNTHHPMKLPSLYDLNPDTLYDVIMEQIDPRLCTYNLHKLDTLCPTLSSEQNAAMNKEFKAAFIKLREVKANYFVELQEELNKIKQSKLGASEDQSRANEEQVLHDLEILFT